MVENHPGSSDLLDTTDCLEAVGVFKGWKNLLSLILVVCLLLLQAGFFLVDQGYVAPGPAQTDGPETQAVTDIEPNGPADANVPAGPDPTPGPRYVRWYKKRVFEWPRIRSQPWAGFFSVGLRPD